MTRKAHNEDKQATQEAAFMDSRSYVTHRGHQYLFGDDVGLRRMVIRVEAGGNCALCGRHVGREGELDHIKGGITDDRCWCLHNLQWVCKPCHRKKHVAPRFGSEKVVA